MGIKKLVFLLLSFCCSTISLAVQRDSISIDPRWNYWHVDAIAPNGNWTFVYQIYPNNLNHNKAYAVHTDTKQKVEVTAIGLTQFTNNDFLIGKKELETVEVNLTSEKQNSLGVLKQQDWIEDNQTLCYITEQNELVLKKYSKKGSQIIWCKKGISKYHLNPAKTRLLYQKEGNTILFQLDLKTLEEKQLVDITETLPYQLEWNSQENAIALSLKEKDILYIDAKKGVSRFIELPKANASISEVQISFFTNDDFYISYRIDHATKDPTKDYLDIWNGNDRQLKYKVLEKKEGDLKAFIYNQSTDKLKELPRSYKYEYLNIGIPNYLLVYDPLELQDYSQVFENVRYRILDLKTMQEKGDLATAVNFQSLYNKAPNGKFLLYPNKDIWEVYDFESHKRTIIPHTDTRSTPFWTEDSKSIFYQDGQNILAYNLENQQTKAITNFKEKNRFRFVNTIRKPNSTFVVSNNPFIFSSHIEDYKTSYYSLFKNKITKLVDSSENKLNTQYLNNGVSKDRKTVVWTEENYNLPQTVKVYRNEKVSTLLEPEVPTELYSWRKQKVIHYKDKFGVDLSGILWYPKDYNSIKKYPMVTWIYERLGYLRSEFKIPSLFNQSGFNRALKNDEGYFVFMPDTYVSEEGPGLSAVECVTKGIEVITAMEPSIDKTKLGLIGTSFGGYETSFILGNSKLFAAGISGAGIHDLINFTYEYNYNLRIPNWYRVEGPQQDLRETFDKNPSKYYNNSPIHFAQNFETPMLLWTGLKDYNVHWEQTRHMYIALQRYKKSVIALFYKNAGHSLSVNNEQKDLTIKVLDWFNYYLIEKKETEWINKGVNYNTY
ncbi:alpha/beta hydrolase family protein [Myroides guanonis]|uniref:Prolyl oligopeptidase family protein n=1 Tax=Myroides guanonis TaxID=1150112 RepID=A0A1I3PE58_9FLAO|nr:prolyl oligopeptidase family serine peptidase [Myroides guanonis]SFJ19825.1 Prolyl oligopeptidase family protein [Myroides guanonis]